MTAITSAVTEVMTLVESMLTSITGNAILVVVLASGFVRMALSVLRRLFRTSRSLYSFNMGYTFNCVPHKIF